MCNLNLPLVAWIDSELPASEADAVEKHLQACAECRASVAAFTDTGHDFAAYYAGATHTSLTKPDRRMPRWVPIVAAIAAAAAVALLASLPRTANSAPSVSQVALEAAPAVGVEATSSQPLPPNHRVHAAVHRKTQAVNWTMSGPAIEIAIPADSIFPPGAVPEGVSYVANLTLADGSVQAIRLQP